MVRRVFDHGRGGGRDGCGGRGGNGGRDNLCGGDDLLYAADAHVKAVILAIVPLDLKFGQIVFPKEFRERLNEGNI
jgi:hypothetical protein